MASPHSPTAAGGGATGAESLVSITSAALLDAAPLIEDKTSTSLTRDTDTDKGNGDNDKAKGKTRRKKAATMTIPMAMAKHNRLIDWDDEQDPGQPSQAGPFSSSSSSSLAKASLAPHDDGDLSMAYASSSLERFSKDRSFDQSFSSTDHHGVRKRKHSDDPATEAAIASGASTPGHRASPPSHSASTSSTPPSSLPSMSASPLTTTKPLDSDDLEQMPSDAEQEGGASGQAQSRDQGQTTGAKRPRVLNVIEVDNGRDRNQYDENGPSIVGDPIIIGDDEDEVSEYGDGVYFQDRAEGRMYNNDDDVSSNQADDEDSVVEVYGGSPGPSSLGQESARREASPAATHTSEDSDATITPNRIRRDQERQESEATPRPNRQSGPHVDDLEVGEVMEVIDLTRPERRSNYPRGDSLPRVVGFAPQHSFHLPTLQRLVSRSSESMERSQPRRVNFSNSSIDVHEILDDDDQDDTDGNIGDEDEDRYGNDTVRIDSEVREVQLDPHHPWARGPIQLIMSPDRRNDEEDLYLEGQGQRRLEDAALVDDHLVQIDYDEIESESEVEEVRSSQERLGADVDDDGLTEQQVQDEANWILNLRREEPLRTPTLPSTPTHHRDDSHLHRTSRTQRGASFQARSPSFEARPYSFEARMSPFPTASSRRSASATPQASTGHRFSPVARRPSPVPLILRNPSLPMSPPPVPSSSRSQASSSNHGPAPSASNRTSFRSLKSPPPRDTVAIDLVAAVDPPSESWVRQNLRCSICMEVMNVPTMVRCGHAFCRACILRALDVTKICPMCRYPTTKNKLQELEFFIGGLRPVDGFESGANLAGGAGVVRGSGSGSGVLA